MFNEKMNTDQLLLLLKETYHEEEVIRSTIRSTMNIYVTLLISILGGMVTLISIIGSSMDNRILCAMILILGSLIEICISWVAYRHYISDYRRQAEAIVQQAKLEDVLGMTDVENYKLRGYWQGEPLLPNNFIQTRKSCPTSAEFVKWFMCNTDSRIALRLYSCFIMIGSVLLAIGILLSLNIIKL